MFTNRRCTRPLTLACVTAALAVTPTAASARPADLDRPATYSTEAQPSMQIGTDSDRTLALILAGCAVLISVGGAGIAGRDHRRIAHTARPQA